MTQHRPARAARALGLSLILALTASGAGAAGIAPAPVQPEAGLRIFGSDQPTVRWNGSGTAMLVTDVCVASTTGRFRLQVTSLSGGLTGAGSHVGYSVRFIDGSGAAHVARMSGATIVFEGAAPGAGDCSTGPNGSISVESTESDLLAGMAGSYSDQLTLSVAPI